MDNFFMIYVEGKNMPCKRFETLEEAETEAERLCEKEKSKTQLSPNLSILRKSLFWDTEIHNIDWNKQSKAVINRIFERGNEEEKKEIERFYGKRKVETILNSRKTKPMQLHKLHP